MTERVKSIYTDVWQLHKRFYDAHTDKEWEELNAECSKLIERNKDDFTRMLVQAMISEISSHK